MTRSYAKEPESRFSSQGARGSLPPSDCRNVCSINRLTRDMIERVAMKFSLKPGLLFMGAQVLLCLALGALAYLLPPYSEPLTAAILYIYFPTVYGIAQLRLFNGDANMFMPLF